MEKKASSSNKLVRAVNSINNFARARSLSHGLGAQFRVVPDEAATGLIPLAPDYIGIAFSQVGGGEDKERLISLNCGFKIFLEDRPVSVTNGSDGSNDQLLIEQQAFTSRAGEIVQAGMLAQAGSSVARALSQPVQVEEPAFLPATELELLTVEEFREMRLDLPLDESEAIQAIRHLKTFPEAEGASEELLRSVSLPNQVILKILAMTVLPLSRDLRLARIDVMTAVFRDMLPLPLSPCFRDGHILAQEMTSQVLKAYYTRQEVINASYTPRGENQRQLHEPRDKYIKKIKWIAIASVNIARDG